IYCALWIQVKREEWDALGHGTHARLKAVRAYETRCTKLGGDWDGSIRRIDWVCEKTCLVGVEVDNSGSEHGVVKVMFKKP
ncbi:hypothetical protein DFS33DRAFT_1263604, partial [Desarmillaria ectypa]